MTFKQCCTCTVETATGPSACVHALNFVKAEKVMGGFRSLIYMRASTHHPLPFSGLVPTAEAQWGCLLRETRITLGWNISWFCLTLLLATIFLLFYRQIRFFFLRLSIAFIVYNLKSEINIQAICKVYLFWQIRIQVLCLSTLRLKSCLLLLPVFLCKAEYTLECLTKEGFFAVGRVLEFRWN